MISHSHNLKKPNTFQIVLLFGAISLSLLTFQMVQSSYAQSIKSFNIKSQLEKKIIKLGDSQKIKITVLDSTSKQPVSGAQVKAVITYPGGTLVRSLGSITDSSGQTSISVPTNSGNPSDTVSVDITVTLTGYSDTTLTTTFAVITNNVNQGHTHHHHHH